MTDYKDERFPQPEGDEDHIAGQVLLSLIPGIGGPAARLFTAIITPPIDRRRAEWLNSLAAGLRNLEGRVEGFTIESLAANEKFVSSLMHASLAAVRNHQTEKIEALRNAVLNVAIGRAPDEDLQSMFLHMIDSFTRWHILVLAYYNDPLVFTKARGLTYDRQWPDLIHVMMDAFPELNSRSYHEVVHMFFHVHADLSARGLVEKDFGASPLDTGRSSFDPEEIRKSTSDLGDRFLAFTSSPFQ